MRGLALLISVCGRGQRLGRKPKSKMWIGEPSAPSSLVGMPALEPRVQRENREAEHQQWREGAPVGLRGSWHQPGI